MSKGSRPRPYSVSQSEFGNNFDAIFRKSDPRAVEDAELEDEAFESINKIDKEQLHSEIKDSVQGG